MKVPAALVVVPITIVAAYLWWAAIHWSARGITWLWRRISRKKDQ